jgi:ribosomal protein S12 methylthiotransferase accessory factor
MMVVDNGESGQRRTESQQPLDLGIDPTSHIYLGRPTGPCAASYKAGSSQNTLGPEASALEIEEVDDFDRSLLTLLTRLDLGVDIFRVANSPVWLACTAGRVRGDHGKACTGSGISPMAALRRCLGEAAEQASMAAQPADAFAIANAAALREPYADPLDLLGFSRSQITARSLELNTNSMDPPPPADLTAEPMAWCRLQEYQRQGTLAVPAAWWFGSAPSDWSPACYHFRADSNGCAAHRDLPSAQLSALLELIERDATSIWWYAHCTRPALQLVGTLDPELTLLLNWRKATERTSWLLDLTTDLGIPVVAAVSVDRDGQWPLLGVAAALCYGSAAKAAIRELAQSEFGLKLRQHRWKNGTNLNDQAVRGWLERTCLDNCRVLSPIGEVVIKCDSILEHSSEICLLNLTNKLFSHRRKILWRDLTRPEIGIPAARVWVPGLCDLHPRFGRSRLIQVPVIMAWKAAHFTEVDLIRDPLPI